MVVLARSSGPQVPTWAGGPLNHRGAQRPTVRQCMLGDPSPRQGPNRPEGWLGQLTPRTGENNVPSAVQRPRQRSKRPEGRLGQLT
eukprot:gene12124-biopygen7914